MSDTHLSPRAPAFADNWQAARRWIAGVAPDLVVHLGDISADGETDAAELEAAAAACANPGTPMRLVPGNHDIGDRPHVRQLAQYRRCFGEDWWSCDAAGWRLVGLNAQLLGLGDVEEQRQWTWLQQTLAGHQGPLGLFLHKPLVCDGVFDEGRYVPAASAAALLESLAAQDLRFVVSGHVHQAHRIDAQGVEHRWLPSTAFCIPDAMQERIGKKRVGVALLQLDARQHRFEPCTPPGMQRHNLLDFDAAYPPLAAIRQRLGAAGALPPEPDA